MNKIYFFYFNKKKRNWALENPILFVGDKHFQFRFREDYKCDKMKHYNVTYFNDK